jgi:hypothetical protein
LKRNDLDAPLRLGEARLINSGVELRFKGLGMRIAAKRGNGQEPD